MREGKVRRLVPNEAEQRIIAEMPEARSRGDSYRAIGKVFGKRQLLLMFRAANADYGLIEAAIRGERTPLKHRKVRRRRR